MTTTPSQPPLDAEALALAAIAVLERENAALATMDLDQAMALLPDKQHAIAALDRIAGPDMIPLAVLEQLRDAAATNETLLRRALTVQGQVVALVAGAYQPKPSRYGARGAPACDRAVTPRAFLARA